MNNITASERIKAAMHDWMPKFVLFGMSLYLLSFVMSIGMNFSPSLPDKIYFINKMDKELQKGKLVTFHYYGEVYPHGTEFTKYVLGVPGDVVSVQDRTFYINGQPVGTAKKFSMMDEPLEMNSFRGVIPAGKFWYGTEHPDSFDSRYQLSGLGDIQDIVGRTYPIF